MYKLKQFGIHFLISVVIMIGAWGLFRYHTDTRQLNEQIYQASLLAGKLIIAVTPKRSVIEKVLGKKKLPLAPGIIKEKIDRVIRIVSKSTDCPTIDLTILKDGNVVSASTGTAKILVENYGKPFFSRKFGVRLALVQYLDLDRPMDQDLGVSLHYWKIWKLYPDLTFTKQMVGIGLSYNLVLGPIDNTYINIGYGYRWSEYKETPYVSLSLKF